MILGIIKIAIIVLNWIVLVYFALLNFFYLITSVVAFRALRRYSRRLNSLEVEGLLRSAGAPPASVILPAYNEEAGCVESVTSLLGLNYPEHEIIMVNDGSTDRTLERMIDAFDMVPAVRGSTSEIPTREVRGAYRSMRHPNLWLVDKENGGKADALNAGINFCHTPLFCSMDADSILERDALLRLVRPFMENSATVAVGGIIRIANGCDIENGTLRDVRLPDGWLARFQVVEYLRAFLAGRMGWDTLQISLIVSGALGVFRRDAVATVGGFATDTVGEDMELIVRLHRHFREKRERYAVSFVPDPVAWTEGPDTFSVLARQRDRWQRGLMQSMWRHRRMIGNPRYGRIGTVGSPYFFFLEGLGPLVELVGYTAFIVAVVMGWVSLPFILAFLTLAIIFGIALSLAAVALEELVFRRYTRQRDFAMLFLIAVLENFGYRQMVTFWRVRGMLFPRRRRKEWGDMERRGLRRERPAAAPAGARPDGTDRERA